MSIYTSSKKKIGSKWVLLVLISAVITTVLTIYKSEDYNYKYLYIIPLTYAILTIIFRNIYINKRYNYGLGFWSINIVMFLRYIITPLAIIITQVYGRLGPTPENRIFKIAYFLMIYEMIVVFITILITTYYIPKIVKIKTGNTRLLGKKNIILVMFLGLAFVILLKYPGSIIPNNLFIIKTEGGNKLVEFQKSGIISAIAGTFKLTLFLLGIYWSKKLYNRTNSKIYPILSLIILIIFLGLKTSESRWGILINAILGAYLLISLYPNFKKLIILSILLLVIVSFLSISLYKFFYLLNDNNNPIIDVINNMLTMFEDYFSGPRLVAQAIDTNNIYNNNITFETLINGLLTTVPFVNNYADSKDIMNIYFNAYNFGYIGRNVLIIPMIGEGFSLFGIIGAPILTIIFEALSVLFDVKAVYNRRYEFKYIYYYASIWCSLCLGFCSQIILTWLFGMFVCQFLLFKTNEKITL